MGKLQKKRKSRPRIKILHDKAWKLQSIYVRKRDGYCVTCGRKKDFKDLDAGHYVHADCLDFDERNINAQCTYCNRMLHGNLTNYAVYLKAKYGPEVIDELVFAGKKVKIWTEKELEEIIEKFSVHSENLALPSENKIAISIQAPATNESKNNAIYQ